MVGRKVRAKLSLNYRAEIYFQACRCRAVGKIPHTVQVDALLSVLGFVSGFRWLRRENIFSVLVGSNCSCHKPANFYTL